MPSATSWTLEFSRSFRNLSDLYRFLEWELSPRLEEVAKTYPVFIPLNLARKIKLQGKEGVLAREFLPHELELDEALNSRGLTDPIGDRTHQRAPQLIHRYASRALFTPTSTCPVHCRYCFRKNELDATDELFQSEFQATLRYLREHSEIQEVIFTGGDPFTLSNEKLKNYLLAFADISSVKDIRFHTRYPVILPERIDEGLIEVLKLARHRFRFVSVAIHANHLAEFDAATDSAISRLATSGVQLLSQTVLLRDVNDSSEALLELIQHFLELKIRPYYLHHPDRVKGGMHFYLPLRRGRELMGQLRSELPGWALPHYVIDVPGGAGKIPAFNPEGHHYSGNLLTLEGQLMAIPEPDLFV